METGAGKGVIRTALAALALIGALTASASAQHVFATPAPGDDAVERFELVGEAEERIARTQARIGGAAAPTQALDERTIAVDRRERSGLLVLSVATHPRIAELAQDEMLELAATGFRPQDNLSFHGENGARTRLTHFAKAISCIAPCSSYDAGRDPVGHPLEFVAVLWRDDESADLTKIILLADGVPLDGQHVTVRLGDGHVLNEITDNAGEIWLPAHFTRPITLSTTRLRYPAGRERNYDVQFATLTLNFVP